MSDKTCRVRVASNERSAGLAEILGEQPLHPPFPPPLSNSRQSPTAPGTLQSGRCAQPKRIRPLPRTTRNGSGERRGRPLLCLVRQVRGKYLRNIRPMGYRNELPRNFLSQASGKTRRPTAGGIAERRGWRERCMRLSARERRYSMDRQTTRCTPAAPFDSSGTVNRLRGVAAISRITGLQKERIAALSRIRPCSAASTRQIVRVTGSGASAARVVPHRRAKGWFQEAGSAWWRRPDAWQGDADGLGGAWIKGICRSSDGARETAEGIGPRGRGSAPEEKEADGRDQHRGRLSAPQLSAGAGSRPCRLADRDAAHGRGPSVAFGWLVAARKPDSSITRIEKLLRDFLEATSLRARYIGKEEKLHNVIIER